MSRLDISALWFLVMILLIGGGALALHTSNQQHEEHMYRLQHQCSDDGAP